MSAADRLEQIRARAEAAFEGQGDTNREAEVARSSASDVPALLAALEAVLAMHEPGDCYQCGDPTCRKARCSECRTIAPCDTVLAITEALA